MSASPGEPQSPPSPYADLEQSLENAYTILDVLGHGAESIVFRARWRENDQMVAIKLIGASKDPENEARLQLEHRILTSLSHPNVVRVLRTGRAGDRPYLVTELLDGGRLRDRMPPGQPVAPATLLPWMVGLLEGLSACHGAGIIHRDLKPENLLFDGDGCIKLADFSISRNVIEPSMLTRAGKILGTPNYLTPEQIRSDPVSPATDIYSAGVILYELLSGRLPFRGTTAKVVFQMHLSAPPERLSPRIKGVSTQLDQLIQDALAKAPSARPATAREFSDRLKAAVKTGLEPKRRSAVFPLQSKPARIGLFVRQNGPWAVCGLLLAIPVILWRTGSRPAIPGDRAAADATDEVRRISNRISPVEGRIKDRWARIAKRVESEGFLPDRDVLQCREEDQRDRTLVTALRVAIANFKSKIAVDTFSAQVAQRVAVSALSVTALELALNRQKPSHSWPSSPASKVDDADALRLLGDAISGQIVTLSADGSALRELMRTIVDDGLGLRGRYWRPGTPDTIAAQLARSTAKLTGNGKLLGDLAVASWIYGGSRSEPKRDQPRPFAPLIRLLRECRIHGALPPADAVLLAGDLWGREIYILSNQTFGFAIESRTLNPAGEVPDGPSVRALKAIRLSMGVLETQLDQVLDLLREESPASLGETRYCCEQTRLLLYQLENFVGQRRVDRLMELAAPGSFGLLGNFAPFTPPAEGLPRLRLALVSLDELLGRLDAGAELGDHELSDFLGIAASEVRQFAKLSVVTPRSGLDVYEMDHYFNNLLERTTESSPLRRLQATIWEQFWHRRTGVRSPGEQVAFDRQIAAVSRRFPKTAAYLAREATNEEGGGAEKGARN